MTAFPPLALWTLLGLMALGAISVLYPLAILVRNVTAVAQLRRDAQILRERYEAHVRALRGEYDASVPAEDCQFDDGFDVDIIDDDGLVVPTRPLINSN